MLSTLPFTYFLLGVRFCILNSYKTKFLKSERLLVGRLYRSFYSVKRLGAPQRIDANTLSRL